MLMPNYNLSRITVLVVDSNRHMRTLVTEILKGFGASNVIDCSEGADALAELRANKVDLVICDWGMEPMDGCTFTKAVRADESSNPYVPIIMISGRTEAASVMQARDSGITEFLAKPMSATALYRRIASIIEGPRPFVRAEGFVGPERRRRKVSTYEGPDRRTLTPARASAAT
ncbi:MAG: response regulator [Alphaproteobacteria bacterium]|nr:response regulator [Alphaproteobacteria bacterium]